MTSPGEKYYNAEWGGKIYYAHGTSSARGVAILFAKGLVPKIHDIVRDVNGRYIIMKIEFQGSTYAFGCLYAPNEDAPEYFMKLLKDTEHLRTDGVILGGDFNTVLSNKDIRGGKGHTHKKCTLYLQQYIQANKLVDIWGTRHTEFRFTFAKTAPYPLMERIDFFLISSHIQQRVRATDILPSYLSDHSIPTMWVKFETELERGRGRWMFNNSLLVEEDYNEQVIDIIQEVAAEQSDPFIRWEMTKTMVRGFSIKYAARKAKARHNKLLALEKKLYDVEKEQARDVHVLVNTQNQIGILRKDINEIRAYKTRGAMIRSKSEWMEFGEKTSKLFFALEKSRSKGKSIQKLLDKHDNLLDSNESILKELHSFYSKLFDEHPIDEDSNFLDGLVIPQIAQSDKLMLDSPIQLEELDIACKQLACDKCPGPDGFPMNFIVKFWPHIKHTLHSVYIKAVQGKKMPNSTMIGTVSLMEKLSKNSLKIEHWRPFAMCNNDYKIFAKIVANRLQMVLPTVIHKDQVGFMKGRQISQNLTELLTVIAYCQQKQEEAIIISVDFMKAFDTVSWKTMEKVLSAFNFGEIFVNYVMLCYKDFRINIGNNGHFTDYIQIRRGNKQGCPLSALNFLLVIEILGLKLRQSPDIEPVIINGVKKLLSQYADDLWTATKFKKTSFDAQFEIFQQFQHFSGLQINYNKTEIMRIGAMTGSNASFYSRLPLVWSDGPVKVLGIHFYPSTEQTVLNNYVNKTNNIENILKVWATRSLSLIGKIQIVNTLVISQLIYCMQCLPTLPDEITQKLNQKIRQFIWSGRKPKMSLARLSKSYANAGLQLIDIKLKDMAIKFSNFVRYTKCTDENVSAVVKETLSK